MKKTFIILSLLVSTLSFAKSYTNEPKKVVIQESLSNKIVFNIPKMNLEKHFVWECKRFRSLFSEKYRCKVDKLNSDKSYTKFVQIGNSQYRMHVVFTGPGLDLPTDLSGEPVTWGKIYGYQPNRDDQLIVTLAMIQVTTKSWIHLNLNQNYVGLDLGQGQTSLKGQVIESYEY